MPGEMAEVLEELRKQGYLAQGNFRCCQTCAGYDMTVKAEGLKDGGTEVKGCVYWHEQDHESWANGDNLYLAYGDMDSSKHGVIGLTTKEVGDALVSVLKDHGLSYEWDGSSDTRIKVEVDYDEDDKFWGWDRYAGMVQCWGCSRWYDEDEEECERCGKHTSCCCECENCNGCYNKVDSGELCSECDCCDSCCECDEEDT